MGRLLCISVTWDGQSHFGKLRPSPQGEPVGQARRDSCFTLLFSHWVMCLHVAATSRPTSRGGASVSGSCGTLSFEMKHNWKPTRPMCKFRLMSGCLRTDYCLATRSAHPDKYRFLVGFPLSGYGSPRYVYKHLDFRDRMDKWLGERQRQFTDVAKELPSNA